MDFFGGILGLIVLALDVWAIIQVGSSRETTTVKVLWIVGILVFPVIGFIVWYFAGPRGA